MEKIVEYNEFIASKDESFVGNGFDPEQLNEMLFPYQADIVRWACGKGRAAIFADCGLGKTLMQLEWARQVARYTSLPVLIVAPLSVAQQTVREASKFVGFELKESYFKQAALNLRAAEQRPDDLFAAILA